MLDRLNELRVGLLATGRLGTASTSWRGPRGTRSTNPGLALVLDEIDLRVAAERAKLDSGL